MVNSQEAPQLEPVVQTLFSKVQQNLDSALRILEAIRNEQCAHIKSSLGSASNWTQSPTSTVKQPQLMLTALMRQSGDNFRAFMEAQRRNYLMMELSWRLPMFCMLTPEEFIREIRHLLPYEEEQIVTVLRELEARLDSQSNPPPAASSHQLPN
jgi:hypothetical protein